MKYGSIIKDYLLILLGSLIYGISTVVFVFPKELLLGGENPYRVYEKCGFNEYSSFYRAYKSEFGVSPKDDHKKI